jgi:hypothetical protein
VERLGGSRRAQAEEREREEKNGHELQGFGRVLAHKPTSLLHGNKNKNCQQKSKKPLGRTAEKCSMLRIKSKNSAQDRENLCLLLAHLTHTLPPFSLEIQDEV